MRNIAPDKKLALKSELVRHLTAAHAAAQNHQPSTVIKVLTLNMDLIMLEDRDIEPDLAMWERFLRPKPESMKG